MLPYNRSKCRGICRDILVRQDAETREFSQHFIEIRDVARKDRFTEIKCLQGFRSAMFYDTATPHNRYVCKDIPVRRPRYA